LETEQLNDIGLEVTKGADGKPMPISTVSESGKAKIAKAPKIEATAKPKSEG